MAIAGKWLARTYNRPDYELFGFNVYALCSDGDLMEGIGARRRRWPGTSAEQPLLDLRRQQDHHRGSTPTLRSAKMSPGGSRASAGCEDVDDANDLAALSQALADFAVTGDKPTLIIVKSHRVGVAQQAPTRHGAHGAPLGDEEIKLTKEAYGWPATRSSSCPEVSPTSRDTGRRGKSRVCAIGMKQFEQYQASTRVGRRA
jgi:transketolase